jgi:hypothetical protein
VKRERSFGPGLYLLNQIKTLMWYIF